MTAREPLETEDQARQLPEVRAIHQAFSASPGVGKMAAHNLRMLTGIIETARIALGAYDRQALEWLAGFDPQSCAAIAGIIARAHEAGFNLLRPAVQAGVFDLGEEDAGLVLDALEFAAEARRYRTTVTCDACTTSPAGVCDPHADDIIRAEEYDDLAGRMRTEGL